jgi:GDPmannose 4,6-dehydratase
MWMILQRDEPEDFVIATGEAHTVRDFVELAFDRVGLDWRPHVEIDPRYFRPAEVESLCGDPAKSLCGDPAKARDKLGWKARPASKSSSR